MPVVEGCKDVCGRNSECIVDYAEKVFFVHAEAAGEEQQGQDAEGHKRKGGVGLGAFFRRS